MEAELIPSVFQFSYIFPFVDHVSTGQSVIGPSFLFVLVFIEVTAVNRLALLLVTVVPSYFIKISYPYV